ncbi:MAG: hypothetical protein Q8L64_06500 [bacterium]|nr:hypothetical protein [bacterium]
MRKLVSQFFLITTILVAAGVFFAPHQANAQVADAALSLLTGGIDIFYGLIGKIFWWVLIPIGGLILQLLGLIIDTAVSLSLDPSFYNSEAIGITWSIVRDLANMIFIFILIYEGIKTILNIGNLASVKRTIAGVLMAALLLNFSLFFTKIMIDTSNVVTAWLVQGIKNLGDGSSMSSSVRATLQMEKLTQTSGGPGTSLSDFFSMKSFSLQSFTQGVLLFALICVAIYVFFHMVFLIVGRIVAFMILLITAPIGFTGPFFSLGDYSKQAGKWWDEMLKQLMMLPMFFLFLYITLFMVDRFDALVFGNDAASTEFTPVNYVIFIIIIMMLLKALQVAKDNSGEIGSSIANIAKNATGIAVGGIAGLGGAFGRQTIGRRAFNYTQDKESMGALQAKAAEGGMRGFAGRMQLAATNKMASSSFDARKTTAGGSMMGALGGKLDIAGVKLDATKVGKIEEGGFKSGVEDFKEKEKEWAEKNLGKGKAGEENRARYAAMRQDDSIYKAMNAGVAGKGYSSAFEDITDNAHAAYRKANVEDAKKASTGISNQIIAEQIAMAHLENAAKTDDVDKMNAALRLEKIRMQNELESMMKKNKVAALLHKANSAESPEETAALMGQVDRETGKMTQAEKDKIRSEAKKINSYSKYKKHQDERIGRVMGMTDVVTKKQAMLKSEKGDTDSIGDIIRKDRIGHEYYEKPRTDNGKPVLDASGKQVVDKGFRPRTDGKDGLAAELQKKKAELKKEQDEFDSIEGNKQKGKKGKRGGREPKSATPTTPAGPDADAEDDDEQYT